MSDERMPGPEPTAPAEGAQPGEESAAAAPASPAPASPPPAAHVEPPSEDVALADSATLPGEHRGGFRRQLTEPVPITETVHTDLPAAVGVQWVPEPAAPLPRIAAWALTFGILGLIVSFLVGWGFLIGMVGVGLAIVALRRPWESRAVAVWALCLSIVSLAYSAGWLWWASTQGPLFG